MYHIPQHTRIAYIHMHRIVAYIACICNACMHLNMHQTNLYPCTYSDLLNTGNDHWIRICDVVCSGALLHSGNSHVESVEKICRYNIISIPSYPSFYLPQILLDLAHGYAVDDDTNTYAGFPVGIAFGLARQSHWDPLWYVQAHVYC